MKPPDAVFLPLEHEIRLADATTFVKYFAVQRSLDLQLDQQVVRGVRNCYVRDETR